MRLSQEPSREAGGKAWKDSPGTFEEVTSLGMCTQEMLPQGLRDPSGWKDSGKHGRKALAWDGAAESGSRVGKQGSGLIRGFLGELWTFWGGCRVAR